MCRTLIIAEAGVNHNGSLELAKQLIDAAAEAGADYVKFQTFRTENLVSKQARKAEYQSRYTRDRKRLYFQRECVRCNIYRRQLPYSKRMA